MEQKVNELIERMEKHKSLSETMLVQSCLEEAFELRDKIKEGCGKMVGIPDEDIVLSCGTEDDGEEMFYCKDCKKALDKILEVAS